MKITHFFRDQGRGLLRRLTVLGLAVFVAAGLGLPKFALAASPEEIAGGAIREAHKIMVGDKAYCFFVQQNVVMTSAEVAKLNNDQALTYEILSRAGLYMKEANCRKTSHNVITMVDWLRNIGGLALSDSDLESIRKADPSAGSSVKFYMDIQVLEGTVDIDSGPDDDGNTDDTGDTGEVSDNDDNEPGQESGSDETGTAGDENSNDDSGDSGESGEDPGKTEEEGEGEGEGGNDDDGKHEVIASTFKLTSPAILFVAIVNEKDAEYRESVCVEENNNILPPSPPDPDIGDEEEMLPEYRTINMVDRSGDPVEDTLKDGTPVTLTWIEPKKHAENGTRFIDRFPGGIAGVTGSAGLSAAAIAALIIAAKRRRDDSDS